MVKFILKIVLQVALAMGLTWIVQNSPINPYIMVGLLIALFIAVVCFYVFWAKPKYVEHMASKKETGRLKGQMKFFKKNMKQDIKCGDEPQQIETQKIKDPIDITKKA